VGQSWHEQEARRLLKESGAQFHRHANHGDLWKLPNGETVMVYPAKRGSSDTRAWKNALAELRRALGISKQGASGSGACAEQPTNEEEEAVLTTGDKKKTLAELGVHIETRTKVVEERVQEAVMSAAAIAQLLGMGEQDSVVLLDVNKDEVGGPFTLRACVVEERDK